MAKWVEMLEMGEGEVPGPWVAPSLPSLSLLSEIDLPGMAQSWAMDGGPSFLFGDTGSSVKSPEGGRVVDFGVRHLMRVAQVPGAVPASRDGGKVVDGGESGVEKASPSARTEKGSIG